MILTETWLQLTSHQLNAAVTTDLSSLTGDTLVLLHGVTRRWQTFCPVFGALLPRFDIVAPDFRGHGKSDAVPGHYRVTDYVADICELILQHVKGPVWIYGHSLGAMTAAGVGARLGDRVSALVLEDPPLHSMGRNIRNTPLLSYFTAVSRFAGDQRPTHEIADDLAEAVYVDPQTGHSFTIGQTRDAAQLRFSASCLKHVAPDVFSPILNGQWLEDFEVDTVFRDLRCPCLLVQADPLAGGMLTDEEAEHVARINPLVAHVRFTGAAHGIHWTETPRLLNTVIPFLESTR